MTAVARMSDTLQAVLFLVAFVVFVVAALNVVVQRVNLIALGLAVFVFVFFWNALARA